MTFRERRLKWMMRAGSRTTVPVYRLLGGRGASRMSPASAPPVFLLTTTGRKSGKKRTIAVSFLQDEKSLIVVGSNGGLPVAPKWTGNLRATPAAEVQIGREKIPVRARVTEGEEESALRERISAEWPNSYGAIFEQAQRPVPIIRLERRRTEEQSVS